MKEENLFYFFLFFLPTRENFTVEISPGPPDCCSDWPLSRVDSGCQDCWTHFLLENPDRQPSEREGEERGLQVHVDPEPCGVSRTDISTCALWCAGKRNWSEESRWSPTVSGFQELFTVLLLLSFPVPLEEAEWKSVIHNKILVFRKGI